VRLALILLCCGVAPLAGCGRGGGGAGDGGVLPWPAELAPYPGARRMCADRSTAGALRVRWTEYASTDDVATVAAFYARPSGSDPGARPFVVRGRGLTTLAVHDAAATDYPKCPQGPVPGERSIILVTTAAPRLAPAKEAR
jgi:hypothetical protein